MGINSPKFTFISIITLGMISFLFICDRISYYHFRSQNIDLLLNYSLIENNTSSTQSKIIDKLLNKSFISLNVTSLKSILLEKNKTKKSNRFKHEFQKIREKVLRFESEVFVSIKKPKNSKLIYADAVKDITVMTIGDHKCDETYGNDLKAIVFVICRVDGFERRKIIRETWGQLIRQSLNSKLYFTIGLTKNESIQKKLVSENAKFNDILQWNFVDNYYNLTIKSLGILRWFTLNCFNTKFIYKVDDDVILNHQNLLKFCEKADTHTIYGHLWKNAFVDRKMKSKFFLSKSDFSRNSYPDYTGGPWLMSGTIVPLIYEKAITKSLPALPYEDVYITGVVAQKLGIDRKQLHGLVYFDESLYKKLNYCWFNQSVIFWQNLDDLKLKNGWNKIISTRDLSCNTNTTNTTTLRT